MRENQLRAFVAKGSGLTLNNVMPRADGKTPEGNGVYATVMLITKQTRESVPSAVQVYDEDADTVIAHQREHIRATYSVQWFRAGADVVADRFYGWALSDLGDIAQESGHGLDLVDGEEWEPFVVVDPLGPIRQVDRLLAGHNSISGKSMNIEERRALDIQFDFVRDSSQDVGRIVTVPVETTDSSLEIGE